MSVLEVSLVRTEVVPKYLGEVVRSLLPVLAAGGGGKLRPLVSASRTASKFSNSLVFVLINCSWGTAGYVLSYVQSSLASCGLSAYNVVNGVELSEDSSLASPSSSVPSLLNVIDIHKPIRNRVNSNTLLFFFNNTNLCYGDEKMVSILPYYMFL
jgi:hypothetical protein